MAAPTSERGADGDRYPARREQPTHPTLKAGLLMVGVVVLLLLLSVVSVLGGR